MCYVMCMLLLCKKTYVFFVLISTGVLVFVG